MRLAAIAATKIEGDVIEAFVRHTLRYVDQLVIVDNVALDDTRAILDALIAEGLPITIWEGEPVTGDPESRTRNARRALIACRADYLLLLDVDEFLIAGSRKALEKALKVLPAGTHASVAMRTYVPTPSDDAGERNAIARIRHRLRRESLPAEKIFISRSFLDERRALVAPGNHAIDDPEGTSRSALLPGIELAHYPVRSKAQIRNKAVIGWPRFLAMGFDPKGDMAYHWRALNESLAHGGAWDDERFFAVANDYYDVGGTPTELVFDPLPPPECRYVNVERDPLATAILFTQQIAGGYAKLHRERASLAARSGEEAMRRYCDLLTKTLGNGDARARERVEAVRALCERAAHADVPGDVFIAGARRGETAVMARGVFASHGDTRRVWIADSFTGPPPPNVTLFPQDVKRKIGAFDDRHAVEATLTRADFDDAATVVVKGWYDVTLGTCAIEQIAVLVVDVAMYGGTFTALQSLYARVAPRGYVACLTYGASKTARAAVDAFRTQHGIDSPLERSGTNVAYWKV